jgi:hypothetical protein
MYIGELFCFSQRTAKNSFSPVKAQPAASSDGYRATYFAE